MASTKGAPLCISALLLPIAAARIHPLSPAIVGVNRPHNDRGNEKEKQDFHDSGSVCLGRQTVVRAARESAPTAHSTVEPTTCDRPDLPKAAIVFAIPETL